MVTVKTERERQEHIVQRAIQGEALDKIISDVDHDFVADVTPRLHQDVTPTLHYKYSLKNTHIRGNGSRQQEKQQKTLIFQDANLRSGFAQVPNAVLRDSRLSGSEVRLYALLLSYAWQDNECFPGQDLLASNMGQTRKSISQLLASLKKKKLIGWRRQGQGKVNIYHIRKLIDAYPQMVD